MLRPALRALTVLAALALITPLAPPAAAQAPPERVTFEDALRLALEQSMALRQSEMALEAAGEAVELARAAFLPDLAATVQPVRRFGLGFDQTTGSLQQETSDALSASLSSQVNLFAGFGDVAALRRRQLERETGTLRLQRTREEVLFTVAAQYLTVMLDREIVGIREEALLAQQAQRERIAQLVDGGVRPRADLLQQDALLAEAELAVLQAESQLEVAESNLVRILQLDPLATTSSSRRPSTTWTLAPSGWTSTGSSRRPTNAAPTCAPRMCRSRPPRRASA
jgi:outer membrane protein